ncbi:TonB-dependent receptor plug domain-containing protein [Maribacter hydrothermalis]|uniref:TonB-dependent receptor plug domain-containing protein n=1 Tax=Maribacter hydrothermalis TaxID=1836467 RepID=A0A1B7ZCP3_9FLAO|nr:TonB-dependent receptor plug domain-containing protein [Maribacter hydrothermalis]APQ18552.1 hypothetical protein BTR34_15055 [Maribacter hydrothermalis]OBR40893.1 hypothetical protein A9200_14995 [Maribacter hydrothermalis]
MKNLSLFFFYSLLINIGFGQNAKEVFGVISDDYGPLENVKVLVIGKDALTTSDINGKYKINVREGEILGFNILGKIPVEIKVEDVTRILNITMYDKVEKLVEVTVKTNRFKSQEQRALEYENNPNIIKSAFGFLDKETTGYSLGILNEKDIGSQFLDIGTLLNGKFAGVMAHCNRETGFIEITVRQNNTSYGGGSQAIFDVDGIRMDMLPCYLIDPLNIKRIAIIRGKGGTGIYGSNAMGGVVVINTNSGTFTPLKEDNYQKAKAEREKHNLYNGEALSISDIVSVPIYMESYKRVNSEDEAIDVYYSNLERYNGSFYFLLDSYNYFIKNWNNDKFNEAIISDNWRVFENNPIALKSLAYIYEANGNFAKAQNMYKEIFILRPEYAQSYFNLAKSYVDNNEFSRAATLFTRYDHLKEVGFLNDAKGNFTALMDIEFENLLRLKGTSFLSDTDRKIFVSNNSFDGTRLVFEWADSEAEFELQYVNPENRFFSWNHTLKSNTERIQDEKMIGYTTEAYELGKNYNGTWQVNIKYLGNKSLTPTYLKATVYRDFGTSAQRKEIKVFKLSLKNVNQKLFTVSNTVGVALN